MAFRITKPGLYSNVATADYFADPCPSPSLTQSVAKILIDRSPLHAWHAHPRLNPRHETDDPTKFDIGNAAHAYLIGRGKTIEVIEAADWRTKDAKESRERAIAAGKSPILVEQGARAADMVAAARVQLKRAGFGAEWQEGAGDGEVVIASNESGIWLRSMVDWLARDRRTVWDFKTTKASAAPHAVAVRMADDGWCVQAAMHERILDAIDPANAGRRKHRFVIQEVDEPFALSVVEIPEAAMTIGRKQVDRAVTLWALCASANQWPGYPAEVVRPEYPAWAEAKWLERELAEVDVPRPDLPILVAG